MTKFAPSLVKADLLDLQSTVEMFKLAKCDSIHVDVSDGHFVPGISFGTPMIETLKKATTLPIDVHLMVQKPENFIPLFAPYKPQRIIFHSEGGGFFHTAYSLLKKSGIGVGLALNPNTAVEDVRPYLPMLDILFIMGTDPAVSGQMFIEKTIKKIEVANTIRIRDNLPFHIHVEGGLTLDSAKRSVRAGAHGLVSGTAFHQASDKNDFVMKLKL